MRSHAEPASFAEPRKTGIMEGRRSPAPGSGRRRYTCETASVVQALAVFFFLRRPAALLAHVPRGVPLGLPGIACLDDRPREVHKRPEQAKELNEKRHRLSPPTLHGGVARAAGLPSETMVTRVGGRTETGGVRASSTLGVEVHNRVKRTTANAHTSVTHGCEAP